MSCLQDIAKPFMFSAPCCNNLRHAPTTLHLLHQDNSSLSFYLDLLFILMLRIFFFGFYIVCIHKDTMLEIGSVFNQNINAKEIFSEPENDAKYRENSWLVRKSNRILSEANNISLTYSKYKFTVTNLPFLRCFFKQVIWSETAIACSNGEETVTQ